MSAHPDGVLRRGYKVLQILPAPVGLRIVRWGTDGHAVEPVHLLGLFEVTEARVDGTFELSREAPYQMIGALDPLDYRNLVPLQHMGRFAGSLRPGEALEGSDCERIANDLAAAFGGRES